MKSRVCRAAEPRMLLPRLTARNLTNTSSPRARLFFSLSLPRRALRARARSTCCWRGPPAPARARRGRARRSASACCTSPREICCGRRRADARRYTRLARARQAAKRESAGGNDPRTRMRWLASRGGFAPAAAAAAALRLSVCFARLPAPANLCRGAAANGLACGMLSWAHGRPPPSPSRLSFSPSFASSSLAQVKKGSMVGRRAKSYIDNGDLVPDDVRTAHRTQSTAHRAHCTECTALQRNERDPRLRCRLPPPGKTHLTHLTLSFLPVSPSPFPPPARRR